MNKELLLQIKDVLEYTVMNERDSFEESLLVEYIDDELGWDPKFVEMALNDPSYEHVYKTAYNALMEVEKLLTVASANN